MLEIYVEMTQLSTYSTYWFVYNYLSVLSSKLNWIHQSVRLAVAEGLGSNVLDRFIIVAELRRDHLDVLHIVAKRRKFLF